MATVLNLVKLQFNIDGYIMLSLWATVSLVSDEATIFNTEPQQQLLSLHRSFGLYVCLQLSL